MVKITPLNDIGSLQHIAATINTNNERVEAAFANTLSRDGSTPNSMTADIDLNGNDLLNVGVIHAEDITVSGNTLTDALIEAQEIATEAAATAVAAAEEATTAILSKLGEDTHDKILSYLLRSSRDSFRIREFLGTRRSTRVYLDPGAASELVDDEGEAYSASLNSTAIGKSLQYLAKLKMAYPIRAGELIPHIEHFADTLLALQWNVSDMAISGGFKLAPNESSASTFGTATAGLGLLYAYRATGAQRYLVAAQKAANFLLVMHEPNERYTELYGETPIPDRTFGGVTFNGFCDRVTQADTISITSTTWNIVACEFLQKVFEETGETIYQEVAEAALAFYAYPTLNFYDVFLIRNTSPTSHVSVQWPLSGRLDVADHSFRRLGGLSISSSSLATSGTIVGVSGLDITLAGTASSVNGAYVGMVFDTNSGAGAEQGRIITAYNGTTKVATIEKAFVDTVNTSTTYRIGWGVNSVGTDQMEYGFTTLHRMGYSLTEITASYEEIASWGNTDTGSFGTSFNPRICYAGFLRVASGLYGGDSRHFGTYYDSQGVNLLGLKYVIAPADYLLTLGMAVVMPDRAALLDENFDTIYTGEGYATKGTIPLAVLGLAFLEVTKLMGA